MYLSEQHIIKKQHPFYKECEELCFKSKNLYNSGLYTVRQHYFENKEFLSAYPLIKLFTKINNPYHRSLPAQVSNETLKLVEQNFKGFFSLLKTKQKGLIDINVKLPNYLDKIKGRQVCVFVKQALSARLLRQGIIKLSQNNIQFKTFVPYEKIQQVRIVPKNGYYVIEVIYKKEEPTLRQNNKRYASIDLGLNNLATISSNVLKPIIINGKPLKSINQYYNKKLANLQSKLKDNSKKSKRLDSLHFKRNNKVKDYLHKSSRYIVNHLVSNNINTLVIGYNKGWKQDINIGKVNNQKFVNIPYLTFIQQLQYKCKLEGINVIINEESYTSKCSFLDNEPIQKHESYKGKRVKRGLFKTENGILINADVNGSLNILKKVVGKFDYNSIEVSGSPSVYTVKS